MGFKRRKDTRSKQKINKGQSSFHKKFKKSFHSEVEEDEKVVQKKVEVITSESEEEIESESAYSQLVSTLNKPSEAREDDELSNGSDLLEEEDDDDDNDDDDDTEDTDDDFSDENHEDNISTGDETCKIEEGYDIDSDHGEFDNDDKSDISVNSVDDEDDDDEEDEQQISESATDGPNSDPFSLHFEQEQPESWMNESDGKKDLHKDAVKYPVLGQCIYSWMYEDFKELPPHKDRDLQKLHVKQKLCDQLREMNPSNTEGDVNLKKSGPMSAMQFELFSLINNYKDVLMPNRHFKNAEEIRWVYCLHALNHVLKTRARIIAHNSKIKSKREDIPDDYRDQGLTRPKVLLVVPFRDSCLKIVNIFIKLLMSKDQVLVSNKKRFLEEFGLEDGDDKKKGLKPEDFESLFDGNIDEHFRIGIGVAKKTLKLYTDFYNADMIIASPLGLRTIIGAEGEENRDFDFLSSIEVLIFDQMDVFMMQNWDHIHHLVKYLHQQPKEGHGVDFSRVRMWTLNGLSKFYRQTLVFSDLITPEINGIVNKHCHNYAGKLVVKKSDTAGSICQIVVQIPQVFHRIDCQTYCEVPDARFKFFIKKILPQYKESMMSGTLVLVPSYFDYVRLRNYFKKEELSTSYLSEYSNTKQISRARSFFYHGRRHFMLYTERFHFYKRYKLRGIKHIIFYEIPLYPQFYSEMCNLLMDPKQIDDHENNTCCVIYSKYDLERLSGVIGTDRAKYMVNSDKQVHMFVTGET